MLTIVTLSKTIEKGEGSDSRAIFPPLPSLAQDMSCILRQRVSLKTRCTSNSPPAQFVTYLGGIAPNKPAAFYKDVEVHASDRIWIQSRGQQDAKAPTGQWKHEVAFKSSFTLTCPPCFETETLKLHEVRQIHYVSLNRFRFTFGVSTSST